MLRSLMPALVVLALATPTWSQPAETSQPASQPAGRTPITARVLEVRGDVKHAPLDSTAWEPCQVDEEYPEQTVILTGVRSSVKFQIGDDDTYTALVIEPVSQSILSEAYRTADTKRVRIGVGYGRMRAGVAEGGLKSDFAVDCPVATLSKRGTWDFGLFYERGTDHFEMFLLNQGLVEALDRLTQQRRTLLPRELVTQAMRRWADEAQILRNVPIVDALGQADMAVAFNELDSSGLRVLNPEGGQTVLLDLSSSFAETNFSQMVRQQLPPTTITPVPVRPRVRPEGYFGTGRGDELVPLVVEANSPLVQKGFARPGKYTFRRSALENWLQQRRR